MRTNQKIQTHFPAAATTATVSIASPGPDRRTRLRAVFASYSAAPTGGRLTVTADPTNGDTDIVLLDIDVAAGGPVPVPLPIDGLQCPSAANLIVTLASGAGAIVGKLTTVASFE